MSKKRIVRFNQQMIVDNHHQFKDHRHFIEYLFLEEHGIRITRFGHVYGALGQILHTGLVFKRSDSEINPVVEVEAILGDNAEEMPQYVVDEARKNSPIKLKGKLLRG